MQDFTTRRRVMVDTQVRPNDVTKFPIIEAMLAVPREVFVPPAKREAAYVGENLDLGGGRFMLDPRTLAKMLDALDVQPDDHVLDIGSGLGYSAAVIGWMAKSVVALEEEAFAADAEKALAGAGVQNVVVATGLLAEGAAQHGPYDAVMLEGAAETIPDAVVAQLRDGGRIGCLFMEGALGVARVGVKFDGVISWRYVFNAAAPVLPGFEARRAFAF